MLGIEQVTWDMKDVQESAIYKRKEVEIVIQVIFKLKLVKWYDPIVKSALWFES